MALVAGLAVLAGGLWSSRTLLEDTAPPTRLAAETLSPTSVELTWASTDEVDEYVVHVGSDRALTKDALKVTSTKKQVLVEDLQPTTPGGDRFFRVDAVKDGEIVRSRTGRFVLPPGEMTKVAVDKTGTTGARLEWKPVVNARQYDVQVATDKDFGELVQSVRTVGSEPELVTDALEPGRPYWFRARPVNGDVVGEFGAAVATETLPEDVRFNVGTWNVCSEKCKGYAGRARQMAAFLNAEKLDLFVLQEAGGKRVGATTNAIFTGGERGFQRATGGAKARYIFYRPALFTQESGGFFPVGHGRHATWARFTVKETGRQFFVVDVHLENGHGNDGKRRSEMNTLISRMRSINDGGLPIVYAGDFNSGRHRGADSPGSMMRGIGQRDTVDVAKKVENREFNTGHTFSTRPLRSGAHVDHIFASEEFQVLAWKQLVRMSGSSYASPVLTDHNALRATLSLEGKKVDVGEPTPVVDVPPVDDVPSPG
ncbi:MAG: hypothetical protein EON53_01680 [Actinomycetales bacterium]|nr:MAG: hypothetical protein EON53_01680 [Actinomycetales bacterium]